MTILFVVGALVIGLGVYVAIASTAHQRRRLAAITVLSGLALISVSWWLVRTRVRSFESTLRDYCHEVHYRLIVDVNEYRGLRKLGGEVADHDIPTLQRAYKSKLSERWKSAELCVPNGEDCIPRDLDDGTLDAIEAGASVIEAQRACPSRFTARP